MQKWLKVLISAVLLGCVASALAHSHHVGPAIPEVKQEISVEQQRIAWTKTVVKRLERQLREKVTTYTFDEISSEQVKHARAAVHNTKIELANIKIAIVDSQQSLGFTHNTLEVLADTPITSKISGSGKSSEKMIHDRAKQEDLLRHLMRAQEENLALLVRAKELISHRLEKLEKWHSELQVQFKEKELYLKKKVVDRRVEKLQEQQKHWLKEILTLTHQLNASSDSLKTEQARSKLQFRVYFLQEKVALTRLKVVTIRLQERFNAQQAMEVDIASMSELYAIQTQSESLHQKLTKLISVIDGKVSALLKREHLKLNRNLEELKKIESEYRIQLKNIMGLEVGVKKYLREIRGRLNQKISVRVEFPGFLSPVWGKTAVEFLSIPLMLLEKINIFRLEFMVGVESLSLDRQYGLFCILVLMGASGYLLKRFLSGLFGTILGMRHAFTRKMVYLILSMFHRNIGVLFGIFTLVLLDYYLPGELHLWSNLLGVYFIYRLVLILFQFTLGRNISKVMDHESFSEKILEVSPDAETPPDFEQRSKKLYFGIFCAFTAVLIVAEFLMLSQSLSISFTLHNVFLMALMVALMGVSFVFFRSWNTLPETIHAVFPIKRSYVKNVISLTTRLIPVALFFNAAVGFMGYLTLALVCLYSEMIFLGVLAMALFLRGVLKDFLTHLSRLAISHLKIGSMVSRALIVPAHRILEVALLLASLWFLVDVYGLQSSEYLVSKFNAILYSPVFDLGSRPINLFLLMGMLVYFLFLKWLSKWAREFCFRLGFKSTRDVGLRHSLSVFSQYGIVLLAFLVGLKLFGFDLQGVGVALAAVSAAFAAGLGFGMRDLVGNIISGILLLVERPLRKGDLISLGNHKGRVIDTGVRSLRIRTSDHLEIIIPNSDVFTKAFVNWTRQDNLLQTKIKLKLHRLEDPKAISDLLLGIVRTVEGVEEKPAPKVYLKDVDELVHLQVTYYVNMDDVNSLRIRSDVLMEIHNAFKENNVHSPYPEYGVRVLEDSADKIRGQE